MIVWDDPQRVGPWVCQQLQTKFSPEESAVIGLERSGELIAGVLFDRWNGRSICMHVASKGGHWLTRPYLRACFGYVFNQLRAGKVLGLVDSMNAPSNRFCRHLGFRLEATITGAAKTGDLLVYSMTPDQCRWLGEKNG